MSQQVATLGDKFPESFRREHRLHQAGVEVVSLPGAPEAQKPLETGDKNSVEETTPSSNNLLAKETNPMTQTQTNKSAPASTVIHTPVTEDAIAAEVMDTLKKFSNGGVKLDAPQFTEAYNRFSNVIIGAGVGAVLGGAAGGGIMALVTPGEGIDPHAVLGGVAVGSSVGAVAGAATAALLTRPKKDDSDSDKKLDRNGGRTGESPCSLAPRYIFHRKQYFFCRRDKNYGSALRFLPKEKNSMKTFTVTDEIRKGIQVVYQEEMPIYGIEVGQGLRKDLEGLPYGSTLLLHNLDPAERTGKTGEIWVERLVKEANPKDRRALVSIETQPGVNGGLKLYANHIREQWCENRRRVVREANPVETAVGVTVLATAETDTGPRYLVSMLPGSSLRIVRTGDLEGAYPELVLLWNGRWDERRATHPETRSYMRNWGMSIFGRSLRHGEILGDGRSSFGGSADPLLLC